VAKEENVKAQASEEAKAKPLAAPQAEEVGSVLDRSRTPATLSHFWRKEEVNAYQPVPAVKWEEGSWKVPVTE
jgi:hypothetical protein